MTERSDAFIRIEHKLDVLINYLHGMTGVLPAQMPIPMPGEGGLTDGVCPITNTPIRYAIDPESGNAVRLDGMSQSLGSIPIPIPPSWDTRKHVESEVIEHE
jgi:hypothetical protein